MKKKVILIILVIILLVGGILYFLNRPKEEETINYMPEEEISDEQLRRTVVSLYFVNKETKELMPEGRLVDVKLLLNDPYYTLMGLLMEKPNSEALESAIPQGTRINDISLRGDVLWLDLSEEFINNHQGGEKNESNTIYSIVNTMTTLTEVNGIKILINGEEGKEFQDGNLDFKEAFVSKD